MIKFLSKIFVYATTVPVIPKPDYLPGPAETLTESAANTQNYYLNTSIPGIINMAIGLIGIGAFIGILIGAINMLTAYGVEDKYKKGKDLIKYSLMGFIIVIFSYALVSIITSISLPSSTDTSWIPSASALDTNKDLDLLFPTEKSLIEDQSRTKNVSLPGGDLITEIVPAAITNIFYLTGLLIFISITYGGISMVTSQGNEEATKKAKTILIYSLVAVAILSLAYALIFGIATLTLNNDSNSSADNVFTESDVQ
ncbi:hypothetical protein HY463_01290 [Candidatus Peregrinibacteria bacterium]|nr:hypothetical protein [Candidatus Peregrinibacteria bacterium]